MRFSVLGSGSRGNSVYIEKNGRGILIDNGFSGKELEKRLNEIDRSLENVEAIFLTHEHHDHVAGVGVVSRRCSVPVYANYGTINGSEKKLGKPHKIIEFETGDEVAFNGFEIRSFRVSHDTADPVGFVVSDGQKYLGYCTDTGKVSKLMELRLAGCHALILEFNHNLEMLKNGPYPLMLQQRVRSSHGHLANEEAADFLMKLMHRQLNYVVLAHLSETNNKPELACAAANPCFTDEYSARMLIAQQDAPTSLIDISSQ